jgi:hypothetical protein
MLHGQPNIKILEQVYHCNDNQPSEDATVRSESRCALRLRYVDLVVSIGVAVEVCCCFTVCSC